MLTTVLFLLSFFQTQTTAANPLVGSWVNQDSSTGGITEIAINDSGNGRLQVHVWGSCNPRDCDWGITDVSAWNGLARSAFDLGFLTTAMEFIPLPDGRLLAVYKSDYPDKSYPPDTDHAEFFVRKKVAGQDAESVAAKVFLKKVAETYRTISAARFDSEQFVESLGQQSASRTTIVSKVTVSKSGFRAEKVEKTGAAEPSVIISDGKTVWTLFPESNEYDAMPAGKQSFAPYLHDYALLDEIRAPARIVGSGRVADAECTKVAIGDGNHTRTLWIDPKTNFIRKEETKDISSGTEGVSKSSITTFFVAHTIEMPESTIFSFDPVRTNAKERRELQKAAPVASIGTVAPEFVLRNLEGKEVRLSDLRGKMVLLDFWATWCAPCRSAMPATELLHRELKDKGLIVLAIDDENAEEQRAFLRKFGYSFSSLVDRGNMVKNLFKVGGIPTTVLIDSAGKIKAYEVDGSYETLWKAAHEMGETGSKLSGR